MRERSRVGEQGGCVGCPCQRCKRRRLLANVYWTRCTYLLLLGTYLLLLGTYLLTITGYLCTITRCVITITRYLFTITRTTGILLGLLAYYWLDMTLTMTTCILIYSSETSIERCTCVYYVCVYESSMSVSVYWQPCILLLLLLLLG